MDGDQIDLTDRMTMEQIAASAIRITLPEGERKSAGPQGREVRIAGHEGGFSKDLSSLTRFPRSQAFMTPRSSCPIFFKIFSPSCPTKFKHPDASEQHVGKP